MGLAKTLGWILGSGLAVLGCGDDGAPTDTEGTDTATGSSSGAAMPGSTGTPEDSTGAPDSSDSGEATSDSGSTDGSSSGGESTGGSDTSGGAVPGCTDPADAAYPGTLTAVDILFVVDNSGSMGAAQAKLARAMSSFAARLDNEGVDYRIAVTTTDVGNPWCSGTTPEVGNFIASSCRSRLTDFVFNGSVVVDVTDEACLDVCVHDSIALTPTTTADDPVAAARPWIERIDGTTNLPKDVTPAEALSCLLPMGINGCGFERPLEAMNRAVMRAVTATEVQYDFFRVDADSLIVLVSDEVDCSHDPDAEEIFLPDGTRVFWSDPDAASPTSALCWNAGVACTGTSPYDECHGENYDLPGSPGAADADAVLHPQSRYTDRLSELDAINGTGRVRFAVIAGVPDDYADGGELVYADDPDPDAQIDWGVAPGCTDREQFGLPPVRMRELAEVYADPGERNLYSVCSAEYCDDFERIVDDLVQ